MLRMASAVEPAAGEPTVRGTSLSGRSHAPVDGRALRCLPAADLTSAVAIEDGTEQVGGSVIAEEIDGRWIK